MKIPLFDIDWTLIEGGHKFHKEAFRVALQNVFGLTDTSLRDINPQGKIDTQILIEIAGVYGYDEIIVKNKIKEAIRAMVDYYMNNVANYKCNILPGVSELLSKLKKHNIPCGLLTGNIEIIGREKMMKANINKYFPFGGFGNEAFQRVDLIEIARSKAEKKLKRVIDKNELVIVGDTPLDVECAKQGGIRSVAVATGKYNVEQLKNAGADLVLESFVEVDKFMNFITQIGKQ